MTISFIHCSDLHLGYNQFGLEERFLDFGRTFSHIVNDAVAREVDYFLIAGDFFNKRTINSRTLLQAIDGLERLKGAGIEVIAIEGNHDKAPYEDRDSWMHFLGERGYIHLLKPTIRDGKLVLDSNNVLCFPKIRFVGLGYFGSMTERRLKELSELLNPSEDFTVLLLHSAADRLLHLGGVPFEAFAGLEGVVDYAAMGHVHERYEIDDWIYNPGAPECWDLGEAHKEKGYYHVVISNGEKTVEHIPSIRRPICDIELDLSGTFTLEQVYDKCLQAVLEGGAESDDGVIIRLVIYGQVTFNPLTIDQARLAEEIHNAVSPVHVEIINQTIQEGYDFDSFDAKLDRAVLEERVLKGLASSYFSSRFEIDDRFLDEIVHAARSIKALAISNDEQGMTDAVQALAKELLKRSPLPADESQGGAAGENL